MSLIITVAVFLAVVVAAKWVSGSRRRTGRPTRAGRRQAAPPPTVAPRPRYAPPADSVPVHRRTASPATPAVAADDGEGVADDADDQRSSASSERSSGEPDLGPIPGWLLGQAVTGGGPSDPLPGGQLGPPADLALWGGLTDGAGPGAPDDPAAR